VKPSSLSPATDNEVKFTVTPLGGNLDSSFVFSEVIALLLEPFFPQGDSFPKVIPEHL
jgi:hypothetical protein